MKTEIIDLGPTREPRIIDFQIGDAFEVLEICGQKVFPCYGQGGTPTCSALVVIFPTHNDLVMMSDGSRIERGYPFMIHRDHSGALYLSVEFYVGEAVADCQRRIEAAVAALGNPPKAWQDGHMAVHGSARHYRQV